MFDIPWLSICPVRPVIREGESIVVIISHLGFWSANVNRIVYVIDELNEYGFAYGTTLHHAEMGEERFRVYRDERDDSVWYEITAFSKPRHALARLGAAYVRTLQKRFARDSMTAMSRSIGD